MRIPGGDFAMGWPGYEQFGGGGPVHRVTVKTFELARTLVTNKQYGDCVDAGACTAADSKCEARLAGDDQPVVCVGGDQAEAFARWVGGRLPSEAEWEYAARSLGKDITYPWGNEPVSCERAVIWNPADEKAGCGRDRTWPVCSDPAGNTEQGLCDMIGDAAQMLADRYHSDYSGAPTDGTAWGKAASAAERVVRGCSWRDTPGYVMSVRYHRPPVPDHADYLSFRVGRDVP